MKFLSDILDAGKALDELSSESARRVGYRKEYGTCQLTGLRNWCEVLRLNEQNTYIERGGQQITRNRNEDWGPRLFIRGTRIALEDLGATDMAMLETNARKAFQPVFQALTDEQNKKAAQAKRDREKYMARQLDLIRNLA